MQHGARHPCQRGAHTGRAEGGGAGSLGKGLMLSVKWMAYMLLYVDSMSMWTLAVEEEEG